MQSNWRYIKLYQERIRSKIGIITLAAILITGLAFIPALDIKVDAQSDCSDLINAIVKNVGREPVKKGPKGPFQPPPNFKVLNLQANVKAKLQQEVNEMAKNPGQDPCQRLRVMHNELLLHPGGWVSQSLGKGVVPDNVLPSGTHVAPGATGSEGPPGLLEAPPVPMTPASPPHEGDDVEGDVVTTPAPGGIAPGAQGQEGPPGLEAPPVPMTPASPPPPPHEGDDVEGDVTADPAPGGEGDVLTGGEGDVLTGGEGDVLTGGEGDDLTGGEGDDEFVGLEEDDIEEDDIEEDDIEEDDIEEDDGEE
jgi:hypothetical protein